MRRNVPVSTCIMKSIRDIPPKQPNSSYQRFSFGAFFENTSSSRSSEVPVRESTHSTILSIYAPPTMSLSPATLNSSLVSGAGGGPPLFMPCSSNQPSWQGHLNFFSSGYHLTRQPRWLHFKDMHSMPSFLLKARNVLPAYTPCAKPSTGTSPKLTTAGS